MPIASGTVLTKLEDAKSIMSTQKKTNTLSLNQIILMLLLALALIICVGGAMWLAKTAPEKFAGAPRFMPEENGYDRVLSAISKLRPYKSDLNVVTLNTNFWIKSSKAGQFVHSYSTRDTTGLVNANYDSLKNLREGLLLDFMCPDSTLPGQSARFRQDSDGIQKLNRLLLLESDMHRSKKEWGQAMSSNLDAIQLGVSYERGGKLHHAIISRNMLRQDFPVAAEIIPHLNSLQAQSAWDRIRKIRCFETPYADILQEEKRNIQSYFRTNLNSLPTFFKEFDQSPPANNQTWQQKWDRKRLILFSDREKIVHDYDNYMNALISKASQPYSVGMKIALPEPGDFVNENTTPICDSFWVSDVTMKQNSANLEISLALRVFRLKHGKYPDKLSQLVSEYRCRLPDDPASASLPFNYLVDGKGGFRLEGAGTDFKKPK